MFRYIVLIFFIFVVVSLSFNINAETNTNNELRDKAKLKEIIYPSVAGFDTCKALYDSRLYGEQEVKNAATLLRMIAGTPYLESILISCDPYKNPYEECAKKVFAENEKKIKEIKEMILPKILEKARIRVLEDVDFTSWLEKSIHQYYSTKDTNVLKKGYAYIKPESCTYLLYDVHEHRKYFNIYQEMHDLAVQWHNCIARLWKRIEDTEINKFWKLVFKEEECNIYDEDRD